MIAQRFGHKLRGDIFKYPKPDLFRATTPAVSDERLGQALREHEMSGWTAEGSDDPDKPDRTWLLKKYQFKSFLDAMKFMREIAAYCDKVDHHPRWENVFREVLVRLSTWDAGHRITETDLAMAVHMNRVAQKFED